MKIKVERFNDPENSYPVGATVEVLEAEGLPTGYIFRIDRENGKLSSIDFEANDDIYTVTRISYTKHFDEVKDAEDFIEEVVNEIRYLVNHHRGRRWPEDVKREEIIEI